MFGGPWQHHGKRRMLRPFTMRILWDAPKNGAELMDAIESITHGRWRPSPGSVYPLLEDLAAERVVRKREDGRYELTPEARRELEWPWGGRPGEGRGAEAMLREIEGYVSYFEEIAQGGSEEWKKTKPKLGAIAKRLAKLAEER